MAIYIQVSFNFDSFVLHLLFNGWTSDVTIIFGDVISSVSTSKWTFLNSHEHMAR